MAPMPVRVGLTLPLLLLMLLLASVVGWLSHRVAHEAITQLDDRLVQSELSRVRESVQSALSAWPQRLELLAQLAAPGPALDPEHAEHALWSLLSAGGPLAQGELHLLWPDGRQMSLRGSPEGTVLLSRSDPASAGETQRFELQHPADRRRPLGRDERSLPASSKAWVQAARSGPGDRWSAVYLDEAYGQPTLALARALPAGQGGEAAVVAVAAPLALLDQHLRREDLVDWGLAYLVTRDGRPLASSGTVAPVGAQGQAAAPSLVGQAHARRPAARCRRPI